MANDKMRYGIIYCGYNTEEYVVDSITPFLERDNFVVSAVSVPFAEYKEVDDLEDCTTDILRELVGQRKLKYLVDQPRFVQEHEARNHALKHLSKYNVDYIWLVDSDEIYTPKQIEDICKYVESSGANFFKLSLKNFVFDKKHYLEEPFCPPRIFKTKVQNLPLRGFYWDNDIAYLEPLSGNLISYERINGIDTIPSEVAFINHYSWLNNEIGKRKVAYQLKHFGHCSYKWNEKEECLEFDENFYKKTNQKIPTVKTEKNKMKKIRMKLPLDKGLGDNLTLLPLANASDLTLEITEADISNARVDALRENCNIEIVENPSPEIPESIKIYGDEEGSKQRACHQGIWWLRAFGVFDDEVDLVPRIKLTEQEDNYGKHFIASLRKPTLCFCPTAAAHSGPRNWLSFVEEEVVQQVIDFFEKYFTVLYISKRIEPRCWRKSFIDLSSPELYSIRDRAAILKYADAYFGTDTGLTHLAVAAGCKSFVWHRNMRGASYDENFLNYGYTENMWREGGYNVFNYDATNINNLLHDMFHQCVSKNPKIQLAK